MAKMYRRCNKVIQFAEESGEYQLEVNQRDVFVTNNENSKEIIFALPFDEIYVTDWNALTSICIRWHLKVKNV